MRLRPPYDVAFRPKFSLDAVKLLYDEVKEWFMADFSHIDVMMTMTGSARQRFAWVNDLDLVIGCSFPVRCDVVARVGSLLGWRDADRPMMRGLVRGVPVDITIADFSHYGATVVHDSGSKEFVIMMRKIARRFGMKFNRSGLHRAIAPDGILEWLPVHTFDEDLFFKQLELKWIPVEDRGVQYLWRPKVDEVCRRLGIDNTEEKR